MQEAPLYNDTCRIVTNSVNVDSSLKIDWDCSFVLSEKDRVICMVGAVNGVPAVQMKRYTEVRSG